MPSLQCLFARVTSLPHAGRWLTWGLLVLGAVLAVVLEPYPSGPSVARGEVPEGFKHVGFNVLSGFDFPEEIGDRVRHGFVPSAVPSSVRDLQGRNVFIKGFMLPFEGDDSGITVFSLNAAYDMCYFGAPVRPNDWVLIRMKTGTHAEYTHLPVAVWGKLEIGADGEDGRLGSFYRVVDASAHTRS